MILLWVLVVVFFFILAMDRFVGRMYRIERKSSQVTPQEFDLRFDVLLIPGLNNAQLYTWWIPTSPDAPTLILVHGWGRNVSRTMPFLREFHSLGYNLLTFDARSHGQSSIVDHPTVETFSQDILSVIDYLTRSELVSSPEIGILGLSIGGGAAINAAAWDKRVKSAITIGALSHPVDVMNLEFQKRKLPTFLSGIILVYLRFRYGIDFNKIAPVNNIANSAADILLIHGEKDETIPLAQGQALARAGNPERTQLWIVAEKGHSNCDSHPEFWERVSAFLQKALPVQEKNTKQEN